MTTRPRTDSLVEGMSARAPTKRGRRASRHVEPDEPAPAVVDCTLGEVNDKSRRLIAVATVSVGLVAVFGTGLLLFIRVNYALPFVMMMGPTWGGLQFWRATKGFGLPLLPVLFIQEALIYAAPVVFFNPSIENYSSEILWRSAVAGLVSVVAACAGWWFGSELLKPASSRFHFAVYQPGFGANRMLGLGLKLLCLGVAFDAMGASGLIWKLLPGNWTGLYPVLRTFAGAANSLGAVLGGIGLGSRGGGVSRVLFWLLFWTEFLLSVRDTLMSSGMTLVIGLVVGLAIGRRRLPWGFLMVAAAIVAFLNFGKFPMREKYTPDTAGRTLENLPSFYLEWVNESLRLLNLKQLGEDKVNILGEGEEGQWMFMRVDNLQNLLFVVDAIESGGVEPLWGKSYWSIPKLVVPRLLWPDKPRTHEGQVLLNLYYGRQANVEETERTCVAWGLLPEAVGNFGVVWGPIGFGLVAGLICGVIEVWSVKKRLLSLEGFLCLAFLMQLAGSFEMVASVFVTSTFQLICAVTMAGLGVYCRVQNRLRVES